MPLAIVFLVTAGAGLVALAMSLLLLRHGGGRFDLARRLAGPAEVKVGRLVDAAELPARPVRVVGRIRCADPLHLGGGERLVAFHRDVDVRLPGAGWRSVERLRETRSFELWDHDGSITFDPSDAAEPLITIPKVWRGSPAQLEEPHASAVERLAERHGAPTEARSTTRTINVTDRLLVVARPVREVDGSVRLEPPPGGALISTLALDDAMRLLGGPRRRVMVAGVAGLAVATALIGIGAIGLVVTSVLR